PPAARAASPPHEGGNTLIPRHYWSIIGHRKPRLSFLDRFNVIVSATRRHAANLISGWDRADYLALHGVGFQPDVSACLRKCVLRMKLRVRYCGSSTILFTTSP